jgi:hypothetical protein
LETSDFSSFISSGALRTRSLVCAWTSCDPKNDKTQATQAAIPASEAFDDFM